MEMSRKRVLGEQIDAAAAHALVMPGLGLIGASGRLRRAMSKTPNSGVVEVAIPRGQPLHRHARAWHLASTSCGREGLPRDTESLSFLRSPRLREGNSWMPGPML